MLEEELQERLELLDSNLVLVSEKEFHLKEKKSEGIAELTLELHNFCILFSELEKKKLGYFKNKKCADFLMFERNQGSWIVHIFELKRSVGESEWKKMKEQFKGALQNALAVAGILGIDIELNNVSFYSAYRNDKLNDYANPGKMRYQMYRHKTKLLPQDCRDWNEESIAFEFLGTREFMHKKIQLELETGKGVYAVS